jgi:hypothetical protein
MVFYQLGPLGAGFLVSDCKAPQTDASVTSVTHGHDISQFCLSSGAAAKVAARKSLLPY